MNFHRTHPGISLLLCCLLLASNASIAQQGILKKNESYLTPGRLLDTVIDHLGNKYPLGAIAINPVTRRGATGYSPEVTTSTCSSGYFQLYLDAGCGLDGSDPASMARLNVVCQVLHDVSQMIGSPLTTTGQKINISVRSLSSIGLGSSGFAAVATSFYNLPSSNTASGIADNAIWITLNSGTDAYTNVSNPVTTVGGAYSSYGATYFHGLMAFRCDGTIAWHTDLTTPPGPGERDLYSVTLHELLHALGFASLIDYNGTSVLGTGYNYFSRYDEHLQTATGTKLVKTTSGCDRYGWSFNAALTPSAVLSPGSSSSTCPLGYQTGTYVNHTVCADAIKYVGSTTQPVYTSSCYERGSSLSHFEDECYAPAGFPLTPPASNDHYFVMANSNLPGPYSATTNPGAMKRYPTPEERQVLCDLGYNAGTTFGNTANLNYKNYGGSACPGAGVAGINDGMGSGGTYSYFTIPGTPVAINGGTAGSILANDYGADSFSCLEVVTGSGSLSATAGSAGTMVSYSPAPGTFGVQLLRYVPVSATGNTGNITYVYVFVGDTGCNPTACDLVANGDFEGVAPGGCGDAPGILHCWSDYAQTPDLFSRGSASACGPVIDVPSILCVPSIDVHPLSSGPNNHFVGFIGYGGPGGAGPHCEAFQSPLTSNIIHGHTYVVSCWAKVADNPSFYIIDLPNHIQLGISTSVAPLAPIDWNLFGLPAGLDSLCTFLVTHPDREWHYYTKTVTYNGATGGRLVLLNAAYLNSPLSPYPSIYETYTMVDDLSIRPVEATCTFDLPDTMCTGSGLYDLASTVSIPGGTFRWLRDSSGVAVLTDSTLFDPATAYAASYLPGGDSGIVQIAYTYTTVPGCTHTVYSEVLLRNATVTPVTGAKDVCLGSTSTLANGTSGGSWTSNYMAVATVDPGTGIVSGIAAGTANIDYVLPDGCFASATVTVSPMPITGSLTVSVGGMVTLADATPGGTWSSSNSAIATIGSATGIVAGISTGTANITYTTTAGCKATVTVTVGVHTGVSNVNGKDERLMVIPNPNSGTFIISGLVDFAGQHEVAIEIADVMGRIVYQGETISRDGKFRQEIRLGSSEPNGVYFVRVRGSGITSTAPFMLSR